MRPWASCLGSCGRAKPCAAGANGAQPLGEAGPSPRLDLGVARLVLRSRRLEILEPGVGLFDHQQLLGVLGTSHFASLQIGFPEH
jgi:hypothetical protein